MTLQDYINECNSEIVKDGIRRAVVHPENFEIKKTINKYDCTEFEVVGIKSRTEAKVIVRY